MQGKMQGSLLVFVKYKDLFINGFPVYKMFNILIFVSQTPSTVDVLKQQREVEMEEIKTARSEIKQTYIIFCVCVETT